jgi:ribosomal protein L16 Arg81 hydroxylase
VTAAIYFLLICHAISAIVYRTAGLSEFLWIRDHIKMNQVYLSNKSALPGCTDNERARAMELDGERSSNGNDPEPESRSLEYILEGKVTEFFDLVWQQSCAIFPQTLPLTSDAEVGPWKWERIQENPVRALVHHGFLVLTDLMDQSTVPSPHESMSDEFQPLLFRNQQLIAPEERAQYSYADDSSDTSLWAAFLNGCSVVINHVDTRSPWIAALCNDLQASVPHAYANAYITPPQSQTVPAHADDRDVFIIQVYGRKNWTVYGNVPIPLPYPHEQVGKSDDLPVPEAVLAGPILIQRTLSPGDVLYMPRGYVHEASSCDDCCSFHVTVAIATHDWTLAGLLASAAQSVLARKIEFRKAIPRQLGRQRTHRTAGRDTRREKELLLHQQLDEAFQMLRNEFTVDSIDTALSRKYERHNQRAAVMREQLFEYKDDKIAGVAATNDVPVHSAVGRAAASRVTLSTFLRAATAEEKTDLLTSQHQILSPAKSALQQRGLHVRTEIYERVSSMIQYLKNDPSLTCELRQLKAIVLPIEHGSDDDNDLIHSGDCICELTLLSVARRCVELGALAVAC